MANRIQALMEQLQETDFVAPSQVQAGTYSSSQGSSRHSYFAPLHYEANYAYPLLVWLHGGGDDETQLRRIMPLVSMRNYVAVAPRGVARRRDGSQPGYHWPQSWRQIQRATQRILDGVERAKNKFNVAPGRVLLAGYGSGGTMAFRMAMQYPRLFAGALSLGGAFPTGNAPLARIAEARRVPLFIACGRYSEQYTQERVCANLRLFHTAGMSVNLRQYPCGDEVMPQMFSDMDRWIMEQILPAQAATVDDSQSSSRGLN